MEEVTAPKPPQKKPDCGLQLHMGTKIVLFGEMFSGLMKQKWNCLAIMTILCLEEKGEACKPKYTMPTVKHGGDSIMLWGCCAAGGTGAVHKIDGITRQENYWIY